VAFRPQITLGLAFIVKELSNFEKFKRTGNKKAELPNQFLFRQPGYRFLAQILLRATTFALSDPWLSAPRLL